MKFIGGYQVEGLLGHGGMGKVFKVRHIGGGPARALKLLRPNPFLTSLMGEDEIRRSFVAEASALAAINHPNVVAVRHAELDRPEPFYVMEHFCNNLGQLMGEGYDIQAPSRAVEPSRALDFMTQCLAGLAALHKAGIVHRDFKPFNVMLGELDQVKISDLGLSRLRGEVRPGPPNLRIGSPHYAAPEQEAHPENAGPRADLYSASVSLFRMVSGRLPNGQRASELNENLGPEWDELFRIGLAAKPGERFASAGEMAGALAELAEAWRKRLGDTCAAPPQWLAKAAPDKIRPLRIEPRKVALAHAADAFGLDDLWRPRHNNAVFEQTVEGVVKDTAHGLVWQRGGSGSVMTWAEAWEYVASLNRQRAFGFNDWRLPTAAEAVTLLREPGSANDICTDSLFDQAQLRVWTSDRCAFTSAWVTCFDGGYLGRHDLDCHNFVRAVRRA